MSNNTQEYWDINGVSLNQFCWSIKSFGGSRLAVPKLRGDNILYPFRTGRSFRPKKADSKVVTLAMWVAGIDPSTDDPAQINQDVQFNDNWRTLQQLFWSPDQQLLLTRRWWEGATSPVLKEATALVELAGTMDPTMTGRSRADFAVDLLMADPFFYGDEVETTIEANTTEVINNPGDSEIWHNVTITLNGELVSPVLTNLTTTPEVWMRINTAIVDDPVEIDTFNNSNMTGSVTHSGFRAWIKLVPGNNSIKLTSLGNSTGNAVLRFNPAYL
jgi:hypothetical protein